MYGSTGGLAREPCVLPWRTGGERESGGSFDAGVMVDGSGTLAEPGVSENRFVDKALGARHGGGQGQSKRQARGDGGGVGAAGAVGMQRGQARRREFVPSGAIEEKVRGIAFQVAAFDEHGSRAQFTEPASGAAHLVRRVDLHI